ncbi:MAG: hypothetical protein ACI4J2_12485 [Ruminococcus sp.]
MVSEYEEIQRYLDSEADNYVLTEEILKSCGLTFESALKSADEYRERFFSLLKEKHISDNNICRICLEVSELMKTDKSYDAIFIYTALLSENGLLFGNIFDDEQKVLLWLDCSEKSERLTEAIMRESVLKERMLSASKSVTTNAATETDLEEQALLYRMAVQNTFLYKIKSGNIFLENVGELIRKVNANQQLKEIKPYVYFAVLSRKHKMMTERQNYSPNIANVFEYMDYRISSDNGKNFDTYQSYTELYEQLRRHYEDECDIELADYCFANLCNLSRWYYENCEPDEDIPKSLAQMIEDESELINLSCAHTELSEFIESNPVLEIAYGNALAEGEWRDFITAMQNSEDIKPFVHRLYNLANAEKISSDKEKAMQYAELRLLQIMEDVNRKMLIGTAKTFI